MAKKNIIESSITAVLVFILLIMVMQWMGKIRGTKHLQAKSKTEDISKDKPIIVEHKGLFEELEVETRNLELKRDPFASSPEAIKASPFGLRVMGIVWDRENPKAIINDLILGIGDTIEGQTVVEIRQDRVILDDGVRYFELRLGQ